MRLTAWQSRLREMPTQNLKAETNASGYRDALLLDGRYWMKVKI
jgi:hypothetical protein